MNRDCGQVEKEDSLREKMKRLGLNEEDFEESFVRSSGPGGQNVNKVATCVYLLHKPTGISVKCQQYRSQALNRIGAKEILLNKIEQRQKQSREAARQKIEKAKRKNRKRPKNLKEKILQFKHKHAEKKAARRMVQLGKFE